MRQSFSCPPQGCQPTRCSSPKTLSTSKPFMIYLGLSPRDSSVCAIVLCRNLSL